MNIETGEIKPEAELKPEEKASGKWVSLTVGEIAEFKDVPCELVYVNPGRRRLTLRALGDLKVPAIGEIAEFKDVPCELVYVNPGRRRLTLRALGNLKVAEATTDPYRIIEKSVRTGTHGLQRPRKSRA